MEAFNFASLGATILVALVGAPILFKRAGYPNGKTAFGTLTVLVVLLGIWGVLSSIQRKAGIEALPLGWLVPLAAAMLGWRVRLP